jgi:hypothetical protein
LGIDQMNKLREQVWELRHKEAKAMRCTHPDEQEDCAIAFLDQEIAIIRTATLDEVEDVVYELYPEFEPTANTILLAIDNLRGSYDSASV